MGLDIGIISIKYLERPQGVAYDFSWELAVEASADGYMTGTGNNWAPFTQRQILSLVNGFSKQEGLSAKDRRKVLAWVRSLPWYDWQKGLRRGNNSEDEDGGGVIELHFSW